MSNALEVTDSDFELQSEQHKGLAVVDFWATWCAPCRMIAPVLDALAIESSRINDSSNLFCTSIFSSLILAICV